MKMSTHPIPVLRRTSGLLNVMCTIALARVNRYLIPFFQDGYIRTLGSSRAFERSLV